jgi:acetylornithine/N-succinyldiaminopimelate aminotransferase
MSQISQAHLLPVFARTDVAFERGEGVWLIATNGDRYLDFGSGVAVNGLGHCHPHLVKAMTEQLSKVWHVSNLYKMPDGEKLADRLCKAGFADVAFFCNSGAEAVECAIKMARKYQHASGRPERFRIITSRAHSTGARWRPSRPAASRNISRASARRSKGSTRWRWATSTR